MTQAIWQVVFNTPLPRTFDYLPPEGYELPPIVGGRVLAPYGRRQMIGIVIGVQPSTSVPLEKLRPVQAVLDLSPLLLPEILALLQWAADYYHTSLGALLFKALPQHLRGNKPLPNPEPLLSSQGEISKILNSEQQQASHTIQQEKKFHVFVLAGITGSGKTEVYADCLKKIVANDLQALVLVPEINLIPQTVARLKNSLSARIDTYHSGATAKQRALSYTRCLNGEVDIVIGTRSALFLPMPRLGLIIVDEENDLAFRAQEGVRFCGRNLAIVRAQQKNIPIVLGSATPALETYYNTTMKRFTLLTLNQRASGAPLPSIQLLDLRGQRLQHGLCPQLIQRIDAHLKQKQQVLLFLNRRGYAPTMLCHQCGYVANCPRCDLRLVYHAKNRKLECHHCGYIQAIPACCPKCQQRQLMPLGIGTERLEQHLQEIFPDIPILRVDRDTTRKKGKLEDSLARIHANDAQLLIGTQMLAKGHDFPNLTCVAVIDADSNLFGVDFRSTERLAQLLLQVAGRAGRGDKPGEVLIQTHHPEHPLFLALLEHNYTAISQHLLQERQMHALPPYTFIALVRTQAKNAEAALEFLNHAREKLFNPNQNEIIFLGPHYLPIAKKAGFYRAQLWLQAEHRAPLQAWLKQLQKYLIDHPPKRGVQCVIDVDPVEVF